MKPHNVPAPCNRRHTTAASTPSIQLQPDQKHIKGRTQNWADQGSRSVVPQITKSMQRDSIALHSSLEPIEGS